MPPDVWYVVAWFVVTSFQLRLAERSVPAVPSPQARQSPRGLKPISQF